MHRLDRVPGFLFSRPNFVRPPPHPQASVAPLWVGGGGGHIRLRERGWADPIRTKGQTLWYSRYSIILNHATFNYMLANVPWLRYLPYLLGCFGVLWPRIGHRERAKSWRGGGDLREEKLPKVSPCGEYWREGGAKKSEFPQGAATPPHINSSWSLKTKTNCLWRACGKGGTFSQLST